MLLDSTEPFQCFTDPACRSVGRREQQPKDLRGKFDTAAQLRLDAVSHERSVNRVDLTEEVYLAALLPEVLRECSEQVAVAVLARRTGTPTIAVAEPSPLIDETERSLIQSVQSQVGTLDSDVTELFHERPPSTASVSGWSRVQSRKLYPIGQVRQWVQRSCPWKRIWSVDLTDPANPSFDQVVLATWL